MKFLWSVADTFHVTMKQLKWENHVQFTLLRVVDGTPHTTLIKNERYTNSQVSVCVCVYSQQRTGIAQSVQRLAAGWIVWESNPGRGEMFRTRPDQPWSQPSHLRNWYRVIHGVKRPGNGINHPPTSSADVKERVQLYLYSPSVSSCYVTWWNLLFIYSKRKKKRWSTRETTYQHRWRRIQRGVAYTITLRLTEIRPYVNICLPVQTWKSRGKVFFIPQEINKLYYILFWTDTCLNFFIVHLEAHFCNLSCAWDTKLDVGKFRLGRFSRNAALTSVWEWLLYHVAADENVARKDAEEHKDVCVCVCACVWARAHACCLWDLGTTSFVSLHS